MLLASVIKSASLLLVQWWLLLPIYLFASDVAAWQAHNPNPVTLPISSILATTISCSSNSSSNMFLICQPLQ